MRQHDTRSQSDQTERLTHIRDKTDRRRVRLENVQQERKKVMRQLKDEERSWAEGRQRAKARSRIARPSDSVRPCASIMTWRPSWRRHHHRAGRATSRTTRAREPSRIRSSCVPHTADGADGAGADPPRSCAVSGQRVARSRLAHDALSHHAARFDAGGRRALSLAIVMHCRAKRT